ncbi:MFS general substrate transporter [Hyaloscypha variabilis F]|uniref:MFS general substrate transporter n=1 Tax=Hyaloscypha variabilis (strain UAMH 11265 / GT02V1 / F) TaxID=1149755 RepID=A0A2J6RCN2_HYAVF|nr:MFS general substrate transporter [Hyaloscypha variabilis F]
MVSEESSVDELKPSSTWQLVLQYRAAVLWSAFMGLAAINWGMDVLLADRLQYFIIYWGFFGAIGSGYLADRLGKRMTLGIGCIVSIGAVFMQIFAAQAVTLLVGKLINGLAIGAFLTIPSGYAAEICPVQVRGLTTSGVQLHQHLSSTLAYKIPFSLQFFFPLILLLFLPFTPESPWHLVRTNHQTLALSTLSRLGYPSPTSTLSEITKTIELETKKSQSTIYLDCFKGANLRRTEIAMGIFAVAQFTGVVFIIGYSSYFFELAGLSASSSFSLSIGVSVLGLIGVICSWFLIDRTGRRSTTLYGLTIIVILLFLIGILDVAGDGKSLVYAQVACIICFAFTYLATIGPISFALFAEIPSSRLRSRTVGLGIVVQNVFGVLMNIVVPLLISPDAADLGGKVGFIFGVTATKGRGYAELDALFEKGVSARRFSDAVLWGMGI